MKRMELERAILEYLSKLPGWVRMPSNAPVDGLMDRRVLDSLSLLDFVAFIEKLCSIKVPSDDITEAHFNSLAGVVRYLESKRGVVGAT